MTQPLRRRVATAIASLALVTGLASGCTDGAWQYDAPPAAGVQQDDGPLKARNIMVLADDAGEGLLLGSVFTTEATELTGVAVAAQKEDGSFADPVGVEATGQVPVNGGLMLGSKESLVKGADLMQGRLATVQLQFGDGTTMVMEVPVVSASHDDYAEAWDKAHG